MSDAMSSVEIEDVLSSIRRLVSEDLYPVPRPQIVSKMVVEDKLILTPALRVVRSDAKAMPAAPKVPQPRLHLGPAHMVVPMASDVTAPDVVTTLGHAVGQQSLDWEADSGDTGPEADSLDWSSFTFVRRTLADSRAATVPTAPDAAAAQTMPEAPPADPVARDPIAGETVDPADADRSDANTAEAYLAQTDWADDAEAEVLADLRQPDQTTSDEPKAEVMPGVEQDADNIFSEQVLRELVRDLIRAELQGDLGERITRNIRKLVRAEIARAVAVQALE